MIKKSLAFIFLCLTAGLFAQPFDGGLNYPPPSNQDNQSNRGMRPGGRTEQEEKTLDSRSPANKLELKSPVYHRMLHQQRGQERAKSAQPSDDAANPANAAGRALPPPVSGPGNPLAPKPTIGEYPAMPPGKKIFECSHCHYIYYTIYTPDIAKCEKRGFNHDWHIIGIKGNVWYRCINCNTHVCCSKVPLRSHCDLESRHIWEIVGQLTPQQQKEELEKELESAKSLKPIQKHKESGRPKHSACRFLSLLSLSLQCRATAQMV